MSAFIIGAVLVIVVCQVTRDRSEFRRVGR